MNRDLADNITWGIRISSFFDPVGQENDIFLKKEVEKSGKRCILYDLQSAHGSRFA